MEAENKPELGLLVLHAQGGDRDAADRLMRRLFPLVLASVRRRLTWEQRRIFGSEEIQASVVVSFWESLAGFEYRSEKQLVGYLATVSLNKIRNRARSLPNAPIRPIETEEAFPVPDPGPSPLTIVVEAEQARVIEEVLDGFDPRVQQLLRLKREGLTWQQVALELDLPESTLRRWYGKARHAIGVALADGTDSGN